MTRLSVNINKVATLRNARGGNLPDVTKFAQDCENYGAEGITVHPRPDERHITRNDVFQLKKVVKTEFNIEGYPDERYLNIIEQVRPHQATLVPDPPEVLTSNAGWDTEGQKSFLEETISLIKSWGVRTSIFVEPDVLAVQGAAKCGTDRIELYTETYANDFPKDPVQAVHNFIEAAVAAVENGLMVNAGHDLNLQNLKFFKDSLPQLDEVSIGHALISDALYLGIENTIQLYKRCLR